MVYFPFFYIVQDPDGIVTTSNLDNNESTTPDQILCSQQCEALHKIASKLHQLENGQRKIIQLLLNLDKELTSKEKSGTTHCSKHSRFIQKIHIYLFLTKRISCILRNGTLSKPFYFRFFFKYSRSSNRLWCFPLTYTLKHNFKLGPSVSVRCLVGLNPVPILHYALKCIQK